MYFKSSLFLFLSSTNLCNCFLLFFYYQFKKKACLSNITITIYFFISVLQIFLFSRILRIIYSMLSFTRLVFLNTYSRIKYGTSWRFHTFDKCNVTRLTRIPAMNERVMRHDGSFFSFFQVFRRLFFLSLGR